MTSEIKSTSNVVSLAAFRAARTASFNERSMPAIVDVDAWYHQEEVAKGTSSKAPQERR